MGTTILLGQIMGSGKRNEAGNIIGSSICFFLVMAISVTAVMLIIAVPFAKLMQTPEEAFDKTLSYVRICSCGIVFIVAYNVLGSIFRGIGDSRTPLLTVAIACVFNIAGDLLLIAIFHMQASGAAVATVAAQALSVIISIIIIKMKGLPFEFSKNNVRFDSEIIRDMVKIGLPIALQDSLVTLSFLVINSIVNSLGVIFSAGVGVAEKVCAFIMLVPSSFSQSLSAFVAQNVGANQYKRAKKSMEWGMLFSIIAGVILACEVWRMETGDLTHNITVVGNHELSELAEGLDSMRKTLQFQIERERELTEANHQMITEMSHDLRTPLTAILLYCEILKKNAHIQEYGRLWSHPS